MSSLVDETTTSDFQDIGLKIMTHLKTYNLFIFYQNQHLNAVPSMMSLEKLTFKLRDDKNQHDKYQKYCDFSKSVNLNFCDLENQIQLVNNLQNLKIRSQDCKIRIVCYSSQTALINLYLKAKTLAINIENIPLCLYTSSIHSDFATFLGWGQPNISSLSALSVLQIENDVRKWVESPTQKIDIWSVQMKVSNEGGSIQKINRQFLGEDLKEKKTHREFFMSNLSVGYHSQLFADFQQKRTTRKPNIFDKFMFSMKGAKKFCCVGNTDMTRNTGIVKVDFTDDKGSRQMLKQLVDQSEFEQMSSVKPVQLKSRQQIFSIMLSNIDRFMGQKIKQNQGSRMNDNKLQLFTFRSINDASKISSVSGNISMEFSADNSVDLQIGDSYFRLVKPQNLKIKFYAKAKVIINKQTLSC